MHTDQSGSLHFHLQRTIGILVTLALLLCTVPVMAASAANDQDVMLGVFWTSDEDTSDTLYLSVDGYNFQQLSIAYQDETPHDSSTSWIPGTLYDVSTLHDPSILYDASTGYFWMLSGYAQTQSGGRRFTPMLGCSKDLVHWSYPNSGSATNVGVTETPPGGHSDWDTVAPDFMLDDDGTLWIVVSIGYYAQFHGGNSLDDVMKPYLIKATNLTPGADPAVDPGTQPQITYSDAMPINLPVESNNRIDGSLYKENGWYYLSIKENGVTNEIWRTQDLNRCSDASNWERVCENATTGYEGPSLTRYNRIYYMYTDKLRDWPPEDHNDKTGTSVCTADSLGEIWNGSHEIKTYDTTGNLRDNRHGTVITVTDSAAKQLIWNLYNQQYSSVPPRNEGVPSDSGWVFKDLREKYWYENGVRQGLEGRGKEIYDPDSDAWYWLDAVSNGAMAINKDVYQESYAGDYADRPDGTGKWVHYDDTGHMLKGENFVLADDGQWYWYYFDLVTGAMCKGYHTITNADGSTKMVYYDKATGRMLYGNQMIDGQAYYFDIYTGIAWNKWFSPDEDKPDAEKNWYWYENGVRQGYAPNDPSYRGKEIYDPDSDAWYWLDNIDQGKKAVNKDVYQESYAGAFADREDGTGKWVRYDSWGHMIKGWQSTDAGTYYFDPITGAMAKGFVIIDGRSYHFDESTGLLT